MSRWLSMFVAALLCVCLDGHAEESVTVDVPSPKTEAAVPSDEALVPEEDFMQLRDLDEKTATRPADVSASSAPEKQAPGFFSAHKWWILAGGGAVAAGLILWAYLGASDDVGAAKPEDLGSPPGDPVARSLRRGEAL